ncbi:MAG: hypothetical protein ABW321_11700 [Polyangiales bacterium]
MTMRNARINANRTRQPGDLTIVDPDGLIDQELDAWLHERLERLLHRLSPRVTHVEARFGDNHKPRGNLARTCTVTVQLQGLDPIILEMRADDDQAAFDLAVEQAEADAKQALAKAGFAARSNGRQRGDAPTEAAKSGVHAIADGQSPYHNVKENTDGMVHSLEASLADRPSRKSTRAGKNRVKPASGLTIRTRSSVHKPEARAARAVRH